MKSKFLVMLSILAVMCWAVVAFPSGAQATGVLTLFDGTSTDIIVDNGPGDANLAVGAITFIGPISPLSVWNINVSTGLSGNPTPTLDLNSIDSSTGAGTLTITYTDVGFTLGTTATMLIGGTTVGTVANTAAFDLTPINTFTGLGPGAFSDTYTSTISPYNPTSLTEIVVINQAGSGVTSFDASLSTTSPVPVPPSAMLLGTGLLGLVGLGWRRKRS